MGLHLTGSSVTQLNNAFASKAIVAAAPTAPQSVSYTDLGANPKPLDLIDGVLYGSVTNTLYKSTDAGATWTSVRTYSAMAGTITAVYKLGSGELLLMQAGGLYKTSGFASNPATSTAALVLAPNSDVAGQPQATFLPWGVSTHNSLVVAVDYCNPKYNSRYLKVSTDEGATWTTRYDLNTVYSTQTDLVHWHGVCWDYYTSDTTPRLWAVHGDGPRAVLYSDDLGVTWITHSSGAAGTTSGTTGNGIQPTAIVAAVDGIVMGTDEEPSGVFFIDRADLSQTKVYSIRLSGRTSGVLYGIAQRAQVADDGTIFVTFANSVTGEPPIILTVSADGRVVREFYRAPAVVGQVGQFDSAVGVGGYLVAGGSFNNVPKVLRAKYHRVNSLRATADTGGIFGATAPGGSVAAGAGALADVNSTAIGVAATAGSTSVVEGSGATGANQCVAIGQASSAAANSSVAVGQTANAGNTSVAVGQGAAASTVAGGGVAAGQGASTVGAAAVAVGQTASVTAANGTALGASATSGGTSVAVGKSASATGTESVAVGYTASAGTTGVAVGSGVTNTGARATSVGYQSSTGAANNATAIGDRATATGASSTALGQQASATSGSSLALGKGASATLGNDVALGDGAATSAGNQIAIGTKHFEMVEVASQPGNPAATKVRLYAISNGTNTQLRARFSSGQIVTLVGAYGTTHLAPFTTAGRPAAATCGAGAAYYDTTLSKPGYSDGTAWRDAAGTAI